MNEAAFVLDNFGDSYVLRGLSRVEETQIAVKIDDDTSIRDQVKLIKLMLDCMVAKLELYALEEHVEVLKERKELRAIHDKQQRGE